MIANPCPEHLLPQDEALVHVDQLIKELQLATSAVERNSVEEMEHSLWRQEMLCSALKRALERSICAPIHAATLGALRTAGVELEQVNRTYGSLVQQGRRSVAPLLELCRLYHGAPASSPDPLLTPLSCEV